MALYFMATGACFKMKQKKVVAPSKKDSINNNEFSYQFMRKSGLTYAFINDLRFRFNNYDNNNSWYKVSNVKTKCSFHPYLILDSSSKELLKAIKN